MKKSFKINIAEPCHENWATMTPSQKGKFCDACAKEVIDFTHKSDEQLFKTLKGSTNVCGRFNTSQLDRDIQLQRKEKTSIAQYAATALLPLTILATSELKAQGEPQIKVEQQDSSYQSLEISSLSRKQTKPQHNTFDITGTVQDGDGTPLPRANVKIKGVNRGTQTDFDGNFALTKLKSGDVLIVSFIGYDVQEILVTPHQKAYTVNMDGILMGDLILGGIITIEEPIKESNPLQKSITNPHDTDFKETQEQKDRKAARKAYQKKEQAWLKEKEKRKKAAQKKKKS